MATDESVSEATWDPWLEESEGEREFLIGLDLGQAADYTALTVVRKTSLKYDPPVKLYWCNYIVRYALGTPYTTIVDNVVRLVQRPELQLKKPNWRGRICTVLPTLIIDETGVGRAVMDMFDRVVRAIPREDPRPTLVPATIHGGKRSAPAEDYRGGWSVAKLDMVAAIQASQGEDRLKIVRGLQNADLLKRELQDFRVKLSPVGHESFTAREGAHDDLVLALALAVWYGESMVRCAGIPK